MEKTRNSNIELLRLVLMLFVVLLHFNNDTMGGAFVLVKNLPIENAILRVLEAFCNCAVNCFMIVSGYFLFTNTKVRFGKILDILLIVIFYRFFDYICRMVFLSEIFSIRHFVGCFLPANYFAIFYVVCYLFSPFIAKQFRECSEKTVNFLMAALLIVFILIPTMLDIANDLHIFKDPGFLSPISGIGNGGGYTIVQFFTMLYLGMWFRRTEFNPNVWTLVLVYIVSSILIAVLKIKIDTYNYDFILTVINAAVLFLLFNKLSFQSKTINFAAKSSFAIFCIHVGVFANTLWKKFFITETHICNGLGRMILWSFISVAFMFVACLVVSIVMRGIFGNTKKWLCSKLPYFELEGNC